jgi:hypothetical protein
MKIVVFDLDETLGYFTEFGVFIDCLKKYLNHININHTIDQQEFDKILDLYPEFLRPNIMNILNYLKTQKIKKKCNKVMIYTNNQGSKEWVNKIISYFESKINFNLIDQIINAFKINGKTIELCRSTHNKTYKDFIKCTKLPLNSEICFLDDNYFPGMYNENVYYINVKPYYHFIDFEEMCNVFLNSDIIKLIFNSENIDKDKFIKYMMNEFKYYNLINEIKTEDDYNIDKILSKKILILLQNFFMKPQKNKTQINSTKKYKKNKTQKIYNK